MVDVAPVVFPLHKVFRGLQVAGLKIQDQDLATEGLRIAWVRRQLDVAAIWFADEWLGRRSLQWMIQDANDLLDRQGRLFGMDGPIGSKLVVAALKFASQQSAQELLVPGTVRWSGHTSLRAWTLHARRVSATDSAKP